MLLKFVFRNIRKRPFLNFIKVFGLALGLCGILFITLFLKNELSYDAWHKKSGQTIEEIQTTAYLQKITDIHLHSGKLREIETNGNITNIYMCLPLKLISPVQGIEIPKGKIIGVVQDFHLSSIKNKVRPLVLFKRKNLWMINKEIIRKTN